VNAIFTLPRPTEDRRPSRPAFYLRGDGSGGDVGVIGREGRRRGRREGGPGRQRHGLGRRPTLVGEPGGARRGPRALARRQRADTRHGGGRQPRRRGVGRSPAEVERSPGCGRVLPLVGGVRDALRYLHRISRVDRWRRLLRRPLQHATTFFHLAIQLFHNAHVFQQLKNHIPLRYPASEPARELVRWLVCDLLASELDSVG